MKAFCKRFWAELFFGSAILITVACGFAFVGIGCNSGERQGIHGIGDEDHDESKRDAQTGDGGHVEQNNNDVNIYYCLIGLLAIDALSALYTKLESARQYWVQRNKRLNGADLAVGK